MKVLIIDDEHSVHEQLQQIIPWEELGWQIAGHAYNGEEAKRITVNSKPHLIITDIKMPLVDGLGYMEWLQTSGIPAKIIVLSGYGDFEYIRPAFKQGAFDYLLKPVQQAELLSILGKVVERIHQESRALKEEINEKAVLQTGIELMQDQLMSEIIDGSLQEENEMIIRAEQVLLQLPEQGYYVVIARMTDLDEHLKHRYERDRGALYYAIRNVLSECLLQWQMQGVTFRNLQRSNEFLVLVPASRDQGTRVKEMMGRLSTQLPQTVQISAKLGISQRKSRLEQIRAAYHEAVQAVESLKLGVNGVAGYKSVNDEPSAAPRPGASLSEWQEFADMLELLVNTGSLRESEALCGKLEQLLCDEKLMEMSGLELKQGLGGLVKTIEQASKEDKDMHTALEKLKNSISELKVPLIRQQLEDLIGQMVRKYASDLKTKSGKQLIGAIIQYTRENYRTVTLEEVSRRFYINKNYFCSLFKSETGDSYGEYLTQVRMEEAKRLLKNSELRAYEIAEMVGYTDQRYFSQVFRKHTGMKPTDYRRISS